MGTRSLKFKCHSLKWASSCDKFLNHFTIQTTTQFVSLLLSFISILIWEIQFHHQSDSTHFVLLNEIIPIFYCQNIFSATTNNVTFVTFHNCWLTVDVTVDKVTAPFLLHYYSSLDSILNIILIILFSFISFHLF